MLKNQEAAAKLNNLATSWPRCLTIKQLTFTGLPSYEIQLVGTLSKDETMVITEQVNSLPSAKVALGKLLDSSLVAWNIFSALILAFMRDSQQRSGIELLLQEVPEPSAQRQTRRCRRIKQLNPTVRSLRKNTTKTRSLRKIDSQ